jgi:hypothetical protein
MPMIFFYFLKIIFDISTSKRFKKYKPYSILAKKKSNLHKIQVQTQDQTFLYIHKFAFIFVAFSASMSGTSPARLERKHEGEGPNNYEQKHHHSSYKNTKIIIFISVGC